jgi:AraC family transcriptional regulator
MTRKMYSEHSLQCASAKRNSLLRSSRSLNWTALLVDHHQARGTSDVFETHPTDDVTLVVASSGRHLIDVFKHGRAYSATYEIGNVGLTQPEETTRMRWQSLSRGSPFETIHLYFSSQIVNEVADELRLIGTPGSDRALSELVFRDPMIANIAAELVTAIQSGAPALYADQAVQFLATHLVCR